MNHYSVYRRRTDAPVAIHATSAQCARAMSITLGSFYSFVSRGSDKWEIIVEEEDDDS